MRITIRQEQLSDYIEVSELVKKSFATNDDVDGTTHDYLIISGMASQGLWLTMILF